MCALEVHNGAWRAMGSSVAVTIVGGDVALLQHAQASIDRLERRWSRFLPDSDLSRLNHAAGSPVHIDPATLVLLEAMGSGWLATNGAFDPTLLAPLVGLGYATSWEDPRLVTSLPAGAAPKSDIRTIRVDRATMTAWVPAGMCLDAGGIGKGLAADMATEELVASGARGASVSIGGDVSVRGEAPDGGGWRVGVADPFAADGIELTQLAISAGGAATSGTSEHRWRDTAGNVQHHLLDPSTRRPVSGRRPVTSVTVVAGTAAWAEVWTKALMIGGAAILASLDQHRLGGLVVFADGEMATNETWRRFVVPSVQQRRDLGGDEVEMIEV